MRVSWRELQATPADVVHDYLQVMAAEVAAGRDDESLAAAQVQLLAQLVAALGR